MGTADSTATPAAALRWPQVAALGVLQGAITLAWVVYALYLPALLITLGLNARLAATLLLLEGGLAIGLEPIFGFLSDRTFRRFGTRLPFLAVGVFLAAAIFAAIPLTIVGTTSATDTGRFVFFGLVAAWAVAMTVFRAPAFALLSRYAARPQWPRAASILTLLAAGVVALKPGSRELLLLLGPVTCFGLASLVLLGAGGAVWFLDQAVPASAPNAPDGLGRAIWPALTLAAAGGGIALAQFALFTQLLPRLFASWPAGGPSLAAFTAMAFAWLGLGALAAGAVATKFGNERTMVAGAIGTALSVAFLAYGVVAPVLSLALVAAAILLFGFVVNGAIPLALGRLPEGRAGLGLGMLFGGSSAIASLATSRFPAPASVLEAILLAWIGLGLAAAAVWAGSRGTKR